MGFTYCLCSLQGLLFSTPECLKEPQDLVKLYLHESNRVYRDKMVEEKDYGTFDKIQLEMVKKFYDVSIEVCNCDNNIHAYRKKSSLGKQSLTQGLTISHLPGGQCSCRSKISVIHILGCQCCDMSK